MNLRISRYKKLLAPIAAADAELLSVLYVAVANYGSDNGARIRIANDASDAIEALLNELRREEKERKSGKESK